VYLILLAYVAGIDDRQEEVSSETKMGIHAFEARRLSAVLLTLLVGIDHLATFALET
jgi:succinate dehydrogenase hydrophobic anchor subunit